MADHVTDPALLAQLEGPSADPGGHVTDPAILAQLEGASTPDSGIADAASRAFGRGAWALPSALSAGYLNHARAQALYKAIGQRNPGESYSDAQKRIYEAQIAAEGRAEKNHPWASALATGIGELPAAAVGGKVLGATELGTSLLQRALASSAQNAGIAGSLEYGRSNAPTPGGKLVDAATAAVAGGALGVLTPAPVKGQLQATEFKGTPAAQAIQQEGHSSHGRTEKPCWHQESV